MLLNKTEWMGKGKPPAAKEDGGACSEPEERGWQPEVRVGRGGASFSRSKYDRPPRDRRSRRGPRRRDRDHAGRPPLSRARPREESQLRSAENQSAGLAKRRLSRRYARSLLGASARGVREAGRGRDGREGRDASVTIWAACCASWRSCRTTRSKSARTRSREIRDHRRRPHGRSRAASGSRICSTASCADFERCGMVGEETNKLAGYLAAVSRHLEAPLAVVLQSSSAAGKSRSWNRCWRFVPEEAAHPVFGDDGPIAVLHGRNGSEAQGARHRRRRRRERARPTR